MYMCKSVNDILELILTTKMSNKCNDCDFSTAHPSSLRSHRNRKHKGINNILYKGRIHSKKKKKVVNFHNFGPDPPPLKVVKGVLFFFTPRPKKRYGQIKKNSPLKTQKN